MPSAPLVLPLLAALLAAAPPAPAAPSAPAAGLRAAADTLPPSAPEAPMTVRDRWRAPFAVRAVGRVAPRPEAPPLVRPGAAAAVRAPESAVAEAPAPGVHEVAPGETLYGIARRYGVTVARLREANGMTEADVLRAGRRLTVPDAASDGEPIRQGGR